MGRRKLTKEEVVQRIKNINPNIEIIGEYTNTQTKVLCRCLIDGYEWYAFPYSLLQGKNCLKCAIQKRKDKCTKSLNKFIYEMKIINPNLKIVGKYVNNYTKIKYKCLICGNYMEAFPNDLLKGHGCPKCNSSKGEAKISKFLDDCHINYISQYKFEKCIYINRLPFDFYLPQYNICIEYDGEQHFKPCTFGGMSKEQANKIFEQQKIRDDIKNKYCQANNIKLLRIPYWEFNNIENILESELLKGGGKCA